MRVIYLTVLGVLCMIQFGESAVSHNQDASDPDYPEKCVDKDRNLIMDLGQTLTVGSDCLQVSCNSDYSMDYATCGKIGYPKGCYLPEVDATKDYPNCCPLPICPDQNTL